MTLKLYIIIYVINFMKYQVLTSSWSTRC